LLRQPPISTLFPYTTLFRSNLHPDWTYTTHVDLKVMPTDSGAYFPSWREAAARDPAAKAIVDSYYRRPPEELYDLQADPAEKVKDRKSTRLNSSHVKNSYAV